GGVGDRVEAISVHRVTCAISEGNCVVAAPREAEAVSFGVHRITGAVAEYDCVVKFSVASEYPVTVAISEDNCVVVAEAAHAPPMMGRIADRDGAVLEAVWLLHIHRITGAVAEANCSVTCESIVMHRVTGAVAEANCNVIHDTDVHRVIGAV